MAAAQQFLELVLEAEVAVNNVEHQLCQEQMEIKGKCRSTRGAGTKSAEASQQQQRGLLVTVGGRRVSRVSVLQEQVALLSAKLQALRQSNDALRAKEEVQMQLLHNYDGALQQLGAMTLETPATEETASVLATAVVMDVQAQELLQKLRGAGPRCSSPVCSAILSRLPSSGDSRATGHSTDSGVLATPSPEDLQAQSRTQQLWASVTSEAIKEMHSITTTELAERCKSCIMRVALVKHCSCNHTGLTDTLYSAVNALERLVILSTLAAARQLLEVQMLNLETMQPAPASDKLWDAVIRQAQLTAEQRQLIMLAFECYRGQRAPLVQQQEQLVQELNHLMGQHGLAAGGRGSGSEMVAGRVGGGSSDCKDTASHDSGRSGGSSPSSSTGLRLMDLEAAVQAEALLGELDRNIRLQRTASRQLIFFYVDLLSVEQHADALLAAYPHNVRVPAFLSRVWQQEVARLDAHAAGAPGSKGADK